MTSGYTKIVPFLFLWQIFSHPHQDLTFWQFLHFFCSWTHENSSVTMFCHFRLVFPLLATIINAFSSHRGKKEKRKDFESSSPREKCVFSDLFSFLKCLRGNGFFSSTFFVLRMSLETPLTKQFRDFLSSFQPWTESLIIILCSDHVDIQKRLFTEFLL